MSHTRKRWNHLSKVLCRGGPFVQNEFDHQLGLDVLEDIKVLVVGAGGLGCELLKDLALMGFSDIHVIDCDTIDLSNLNRQFLFRTKDIGRSKAVVAAEFIRNRVPGCSVIGHESRIEDKDSDFYRQFNIVVCGLDAIEPRRWLNSKIFQLLEPNPENEGTFDGIVPIVDGGTEGFKGSARVIIPSMDYPCVECTLDLYPPRATYPLCTITQRPRLPEHCIEYSKLVLWPREHPFGDLPLDGDDPSHLQWIYDRSLDRAKEYDIEGVTYRLAQGVVKNIIPAVASTNSVIAAACCTEVFKLATGSAPPLNNYLVFNDSDSVYTFTYAAERKPGCPVCDNLPIELEISAESTLNQLIEVLQKKYNFGPKPPTLTTTTTTLDDDSVAEDNGNTSRTLYMACLHKQIGDNLTKTIAELNLVSGQQVLAIDRQLTKKFILRF